MDCITVVVAFQEATTKLEHLDDIIFVGLRGTQWSFS